MQFDNHGNKLHVKECDSCKPVPEIGDPWLYDIIAHLPQATVVWVYQNSIYRNLKQLPWEYFIILTWIDPAFNQYPQWFHELKLELTPQFKLIYYYSQKLIQPVWYNWSLTWRCFWMPFINSFLGVDLFLKRFCKSLDHNNGQIYGFLGGFVGSIQERVAFEWKAKVWSLQLLGFDCGNYTLVACFNHSMHELC